MPHPTFVSESVEVLVKRSEFEMDDSLPREQRSPTCLGMFDCLTAKETVREKRESYAHKRASRRIGVERTMQVAYNQPHLVEPMKLTVYDELPSEPLTPYRPSQVSKFVQQGRESISRASTRVSLSARKRGLSKSSISRPQAALAVDACQLRRNPSFRPLQLSIYIANKRLSDLPEFDAVSFTEEGEIIQAPQKALIRPQSEDLLRPRSPALPDLLPGKPASMFEQSLSRRVSHFRQNTESTILSSSRPASEYDALRSHPVSWYSLPGVPPTMQFASPPGLSKKILSPMKEEFTPPPSGAVIINGKVLAFPDVDALRIPTEMAHRSLLPPAAGQEEDYSAPSPVIDPGPNRRTTVITKHKAKISESASILLASSIASTRGRALTMEQTPPALPITTEPFDEPKSYFHTDFKTNNRINQWLDNENKTEKNGRSRESSVSTVKTTSTTSSFAEHRRKRSQFYQLNHPKEKSIADENNAANPAKTPAPLKLYKPFLPQKAYNPNAATYTDAQSESSKFSTHVRTQTESTVASTVVTDTVFERPETPQIEEEDDFASAQALPHHLRSRRAYDAESMTTVDMKSRTGTMKSTATSHRQASPSPAPAGLSIPIYLEKDSNPGVDIVSVTKGQNEFILRDNTPSPSTASPKTPLSARANDVEKMMFEMCAQGGYRRVNVGVAF